MKIFSISILCLILSASLFAQNKTITRDTINLRGVILKSDGKPASNISIVSKQIETSFNKFRVFATTDTDGQFSLNGIMPNDTLTIVSINYDNPIYYNKGGRLMVIILPSEKVEDINSKNPVEITAKRITPKTTPTIDIVPATAPPSYITVQKPEFPGGSEHFLTFIQKNLSYPDKAVKNNIEGTVEVEFTVEKDGSLTNFILLKGIGYGCDEEVLKAVLKSPKWKPGIMNNVPATINTSVSVRFSLKDK